MMNGGLDLAVHKDEPVYARALPDGRWVFVYAELFDTARLGIGRLGCGVMDDVWQYQGLQRAVEAATLWDGTGEPQGWYRPSLTHRVAEIGRHPDDRPR